MELDYTAIVEEIRKTPKLTAPRYYRKHDLAAQGVAWADYVAGLRAVGYKVPSWMDSPDARRPAPTHGDSTAHQDSVLAGVVRRAAESAMPEESPDDDRESDQDVHEDRPSWWSGLGRLNLGSILLAAGAVLTMLWLLRGTRPGPSAPADSTREEREHGPGYGYFDPSQY